MESFNQTIKNLTERIEALERRINVFNEPEENVKPLNTINMELKRNIVNDEISIRDASISKNKEIELNCTEQYKLLTELEASSTILQNSLRTILLLGGKNQAFKKETEYLSSLSHEFIENIVDIFKIADSCSKLSLMPNRIRTINDQLGGKNCSDELEVKTAIGIEDQMREKCMSRPGLSFFSRDKIRCISRRANIGFGCLGEPSTVGFQEEENESITAEERRMTLFSGAAKESEMMNTLLVTCTLTAGTCGNPQDFTQVSYKCYSLNRTPRTYAEAWNFCQQRGTVLLVLSEDRDIRDVLKYMTSKHPDIVAVWTGLHRNTVQSGWQVPPGYGNADYARWMPDSNFTNLPMATIVHTRSYDPMYGSYAGYMSPRHQYEKFPALCVKSVESNFANDVLVTLPFDPVITTTTAKITTSTRATVTTTTKSPVTTTAKTTVKTTTKAPGTTTTKKPVTTTTKKPVTTTTKKPVTTTTKAPVVTTAAPGLTLEELVSQNILGRQPMNNILYRSYNQGLIYHQYHRDFDRHCANSNAKERFVGFVVTPTMAGVQGRCPELFQLNMYQNRGSQAWTFFNVSNSNSNLDFVASFFCAPRRGYCGANFEMVEYLSKVGAGDKFIASFTAESQGTANNNFYQNQPNRRLCWIWRDAPSNISTQFNRARNQVLSAGNPIMRTHVTQQNTYSVSRTDQNNLISQGRQAKPDIGFIVTHQMWLDTFRQSCPELIPMGVHRRSGSVTTYFGHNPPYPADRIGGFYCAPRRGYCGADYLLRQRPTKTLGLDNYVSDNYEDYENVKCTAKARYSEEDEAVCWIWKDPSTYKI